MCQIVAAMMVFVLVTINCVFKYNYFYAFLMITLFCLIDFPKPLEKFLMALGKQSMNMWMIHSWLCYYLFHDFIYSFRYPIIILSVLTFFSYYIGIVIDKIALPIERRLLTRNELKENPQI